MTAHYFLGIDVGTGSARAGVFEGAGMLLGSARADIALWHEAGDIVEQSGNDIWRAVCSCARDAVSRAGIAPEAVAGIGFDATCSLVVLGPGGKPLPVGPSADPERNIIVWMDHRAVAQTRRINATAEAVLDYVGGSISPEMETPKLLWLAENLPSTFQSAWQFMDLADFLTLKATGSLARSICTVTSKWTYLAHEGRWDESYFRTVGLGVLADEGFRRIGAEIVAAGTPLAGGLTAEAGAQLGLVAGTPVGAGLIDAHAGGIGTVGARGEAGSLLTRMAYVFGTSACTMSSTSEPTFVPGVWGPYFSAMVPGLWLNEGGQSAAGAAIEHLARMHPAAAEAARLAQASGGGLVSWLSREAERRGGASNAINLIGDVHVVPEFIGNRSPFADPEARGVIAGLGMDSDIESLVAFYLAGMCGLGYGLRQIVRALREKSALIDAIVVSGGAGQSALVRQLLADTTGQVIATVTSPEPVLLGSAILGAVASGHQRDIAAAMSAMSTIGELYRPDPSLAKAHDRRFTAFELLQRTAKALRSGEY